MKRTLRLLISVLPLLGFLLLASLAQAFVASETYPGTVELRSRHDRGLVVTSIMTRVAGKSKRKWIYFCISELTPNRKISSVPKEKCFYGSARQFKDVKLNDMYASVEYGLKNRIYNSKGIIAIGTQRYFYPVHVLYRLN